MSGSLENKKPALLDFAFKRNKHYYWWASWYAKVLGYKSLKTFRNSINKAMKLCVQLGIDTGDNFIEAESENGQDVMLSHFACFLVSLQADGRKPIVKRARTYFLNELEDLHIILSDQEFLHRMVGKEEITKLNKLLVKAAGRARVKDFQNFMNDGYMGMYNQLTPQLRKSRGLESNEDLVDYMSMTEIAAHIFRISLTTERLKQLSYPSAEQAAREHWKIGNQIRRMIRDNTGKFPEDMRVVKSIKQLESQLKSAQKKLNEEVDKQVK